MIFDLQLFADVLRVNISESDGVITLGQPSASGGLTTDIAVNTDVSVGISNSALSINNENVALMLGGTSVVTGSNTSVFFVGTVSVLSGLNKMTLNVSSTSVGEINFLDNAGTVKLTKTDSVLNFGATGKKGLTQTLEIGGASQMVLTSQGTSTSIADLADGDKFIVKNDKYNAQLLKSDMTGISILATKSSNLTFNAGAGNLNLGEGTDSVVINMLGNNTGLSVGLIGVESANFTNVSGGIKIHSLASASKATLNAVNVFTLDMGTDGVDSLSGLTINTSANTNTLKLSGKGVETLAASKTVLANKASINTVTNWLAATGEDSVAANTVNLGSGSSFASLKSYYGSALSVQYADGMRLDINSTTSEAGLSQQAVGVRFSNGTDAKDILFTSGSAMDMTDESYNISKFDVIVANQKEGQNVGILNLGTRTDQQYVLLNGNGKDEHFGTSQQYVGFTSVISSSETSSLLISDLADKEVLLFGNGTNDSIFTGAGGTEKATYRDTIGSANGKDAYYGTSNYSGIDYVINSSLVSGVGDSGVNGSFDFATFDETTGEIKSGDVITLMNGAGHLTANRGSVEVGADDDNYLIIEDVGDGQKDFAYAGSIGGEKNLARIDMSKRKGVLEFNNAVDFYIGNDVDTTITLGSSVADSKLNHEGGAVMKGVTDIDATKAGAGNIIFGQNNYKQTIKASTTGATSICGGVASLTDYTDTQSDTLVGGLNTTFFVGENMGSDKVTNVESGDKLVFLGTKYLDSTSLINDNLGTSITFGDTTIRVDAATNMAAVTDLTAEFEDYTWKWDGTNWTYTETQK